MADFSETQKIADRMQQCTRKLHQLAAQMGVARQIKEYDADRRKQILAIEVVKSLKTGESAAADAIGRASEAYKTNLDVLAAQYETAEATIAQWNAENCSFEAARSLLSFSKETVRNLQG